MPPVDLGELSEVESLGCGDAIARRVRTPVF
jgi:hypothetical protein